MEKFELCKTPFGIYLLRIMDLVSDILKRGFWEQETKVIFDKITPEMVVVEVGSYIGDHTIYLAKRCKTIYAFEASTENYYQLCANILLNSCMNNIVPYNICIGASLGTARLTFVAYNNFAGTTFKKDSAGTLSMSTLDEILLDKLDRLDLLITDVEGMDLEVLLGAESLINKFKPEILFEYNGGSTDSNNIAQDLNDYYKYLEKFGYAVIYLDGWNYYATCK